MTELNKDEEHGLRNQTVTNSGVDILIDWNLASYVEFKRPSSCS